MASTMNANAYHRVAVGTSDLFASRVIEIDDEIRTVLTQVEPALQPFYGMMLYHLGLDAEGPAGKRLRPLLCVLIYEALAGDARAALPAAAALELLHNFTLIHDDIEDHDPTRHHRPTVWSVWGVPQAINSGDGMYAASRLAVQRLRERGFPVERYRTMAARKTGALIAAACEGAAVLATDDAELRRALARFGDDFGAAFQAHDDLLGIWATTERTGKLEMNDLVKRKKTLPVVMAFEKASGRVRDELAALFEPPAPLAAESVERIRAILDELGTRAQLEREIAGHRARALHTLRSIAAMAAAREPLQALERLVEAATGADEPVASGSR